MAGVFIPLIYILSALYLFYRILYIPHHSLGWCNRCKISVPESTWNQRTETNRTSIPFLCFLRARRISTECLKLFCQNAQFFSLFHNVTMKVYKWPLCSHYSLYIRSAFACETRIKLLLCFFLLFDKNGMLVGNITIFTCWLCLNCLDEERGRQFVISIWQVMTFIAV